MRIILAIAIVIAALSFSVRLTTREQNLSRQIISGQTVPSPITTPSEHGPRLWFESSEVSPNNLYRATSYTGDYEDRYHYYQVFITELATDRMHRIYTGDFRTMDWEWTKDNKIKISYNCGTGCKSTRVIDVDEYVSLEFDKSGKWITETFKSF